MKIAVFYTNITFCRLRDKLSITEFTPVFRHRYFYLKIFSKFQIPSPWYRPAQQSYNPQQKYRTDHRCNQISDNADSGNTDQTEQPAAENTADYTYNQVDNNSKTAATHQFAGNKSWYNSNENIP